MRSFGAATAALTAVFLLRALAWPHLATPLLQLLVALLSLAWVGARVMRAELPLGLATDTYSPFDARRPDATGPPLPEPVDRRARRLRAADEPDSAERFAVPGPECRLIADEATRRLAEHHGLDVRDPSERVRIRGLVGESTWRLLRDWTDARRRVVEAHSIPLARLDAILDDLERL